MLKPRVRPTIWDYAQLLGIAVGVGVLVYIAVALVAEGTWVIPEWIRAFLK